MKQTKYTPGPWTVGEERETDIVIRNPHRDPVALGYLSAWDKKTARANARLIATSPELLEVCHRMHTYLQGIQTGEKFEEANLVATIQSTIAKAEGK